MSFCKNCGNQVSEEKFCKNCGHNLGEEQETQAATNNQPTYELIEKMKEHKKLLSIGGAILAVLIITFAIIGQFFSPDRTVNQFDEAVQNGDAERVAELMSFSTNQEVATEDAEGFVKYLNENPDDYQELHSSLQDQVTVMNEEEEVPSNFEEAAEAFFSGSSESYVTLEQDGKFLFYDQYQLVVEPVYLELGSNVDNTTVGIGDKEIGLIETSEDVIEAGPFLPGHHNVTGTVKNAWGEFETEEQLKVFSNDSHRLNFDLEYIDLELPGNLIESDFEELDTQFYVNGEAVEADMLEGKQIGPMVLSDDKTLKIEVEFPWGTMETGEYTLNESSISMSFKLPEEHQDAYVEAIKEHLTLFLDSVEAGEVLFEDYITDDYRDSVQSDIDNLFNSNVSSVAQSYESGVMSQEDIPVYMKNDKFMIGLPTDVNLRWGRSTDYDVESDLNNDEDGYEFIAEFVEGDWRTVSVSTGHDFDIENGIEFDTDTGLYVFEAPQEDEIEVSSSDESSSEDDEQEQSSGDSVEATIKDRTIGYVFQLVEAINAGDYGLVADYIQSGSSLESDQQGLVDRLYEDDITQELIDATVEDVREKSSGHYEVDTEETIKINYSDGPEEETYNWTYTVEENDGEYYLSGIE